MSVFLNRLKNRASQATYRHRPKSAKSDKPDPKSVGKSVFDKIEKHFTDEIKDEKSEKSEPPKS